MTNDLANTTRNANIIPDGPFNTIDMSTFDGAMKVTNAINNSQSLAQYVADHDNEPMVVVDIVLTNGIRKSRDERIPDAECEDTRLILADGTSLMSQSGGIAKSAKFIAGFLGSQLHDGILMRVVEQKMSNGNTVKNLEVVGKA